MTLELAPRTDSVEPTDAATIPADSLEQATAGSLATIDVVIPVYNEQADLEASVRRLHHHLSNDFPHRWQITVADNASTDDTWAIATRLTRQLPHVHAVHLDQKGRGRALRQVWLASTADVQVYMDVDLSTDLRALLPLVSPLVSGHSDLAIGSRLARGAKVVRGPKREFISRSYNLILRTSLRAGFTDAQCGFKAIRRDVAQQLLPLVEDNNWFFDTEMLVLAQRAGLRTHEVPVDWTDDPNTTVDIVATAMEDLRGVARLMKGMGTGAIPLARVREQLHRSPAANGTNPLFGQMVRFAAVGAASTGAYFGLYLLLRMGMGGAGLEPAGQPADGSGQHRGEPSPHLRGLGPCGAPARPCGWPGRLRRGDGPDGRLAGTAAPGRHARGPAGGGAGAGRGQRRGHGLPLRGAAPPDAPRGLMQHRRLGGEAAERAAPGDARGARAVARAPRACGAAQRSATSQAHTPSTCWVHTA